MAWLDISLETANKFYLWGWRGSIVGAVVTALSVVFLMWGTRIRDHDAEAQMLSANERIDHANDRASTLEEATKAAHEQQRRLGEAARSAEEAQKRLSEANAKLQAQVDRLRQARRISDGRATQMSDLFRQQGVHSFLIIYAGMDPEAQGLATQLGAHL
jgi:septal ring factor EnvC (AmiA/AmiB activator)